MKAKRGVIFGEAPVIKPGRSWFDDSHRHLTTCNIGELIVGHISDHVAGDVIKFKNDIFGRVDTTISPTFGEIDLFSYYFYVNKRHIWPDWVKFRPNSDQMKTWMQNRTFIPPVQPYITLSDLRSNFDAIYNDAIRLTEEDGVTNFTFGINLRNKFAVAYFGWLEIDGKLTCVPIDMDADLIDGFTYTSDYPEADYQFYTYVIYKRNFQEVQSKGGNYWYKNDALIQTMNPFSPGTLFHYMQCNIEALNKERSAYFSLVYHQWQIQRTGGSVDTLHYDDSALRAFMKRHFVNALYEFNGHRYHQAPVFTAFDDSRYVAFKVVTQEEESIVEIDGDKSAEEHAWLDNLMDNLSSNVTKIYNSTFDSRINTLPIRAYEYIYDEYFRDENWIPVNTYTDFTRNGEEHYTTAEQLRYFSIRKKAWAHDPYTSGLPGPQRGDAVRFLSDASLKFTSVPNHLVSDRQLVQLGFNNDGLVVSKSGTPTNIYSDIELSVDLSSATIENFRFASALQEYRELFARTGGRYPEWQLGVMGANISDIEDERPIYIYGSRNPIQMSEVVQTSATNVETGQPLGDLAGKGVIVGKGDYIEYVTPDDGFFLQIIAVVPKLSYQSGINPLFTRTNWMDFPIPKFAQLGEELVKTGSLWFTGLSDIDDKAFAYQSRYWEWKYSRDYTTGQLADNLDYWTFTRQFDDEPINGQDFIEVNVDYRQFAVTDRGVHHIYLSIWNDVQKNSPLPVFGIPTL